VPPLDDTMTMLDAARQPVTVGGLDVNEAEDGLVVYDTATDTVHHLNKTAGVIFGLCDGTRDTAGIAAEVSVLFALPEPPLDETVACLSDLVARGLVK
jgi:Coenzyme PQQ synthesis protein D (PqqD)